MSKQVVESSKEFSKANNCRTQMTLPSQSSNKGFVQASFVVKQEKELMNLVSMYHEKLKMLRLMN